MHIAFVNMPIEYYSPTCGGAISTIIMESAKELLARGHQVSVLTIQNDEETYAVGRVVPIQVKRRDDLSFARRRISSMRRRIAGWDWPYYEYYLADVSRKLAALTPAPDVVVVFNDLVAPKYLRRVLPSAKLFVWLQNEQRTRQRRLDTTIHATTAFLTCSQYIKDWTAKTHNIHPKQIEVVTSGVDMASFSPRPGYDLPAKRVRALFLGRIDPNKGPDLAVDAVAKIQDEGFPICLTVAGGLWFTNHGNETADPFFRTLKAKMDAAGASYKGHVTRPHLPALVREHDIAFVLSRSNEPFGLVALEAMASGCAVIASNRGGLPEACDGAATLVDPDDTDQIARALRDLVADPDRLCEQKRRAVSRASHAPWSAVAERLEQVFAGTHKT